MLVNEQSMLQPQHDQLQAQGGWSYNVIYLGGQINTWGMNIFDVQNRIKYGQSQLNSQYQSKGFGQ